jgi:hypothetical protein
VSAILWVGYPGQSGGQALANILFGSVSPAGRSPFSWHYSNFITTNSFLDMHMRPNSNVSAGPLSSGRTYRFFTGHVVYPFGHGLSYTTFNVTTVGAAPSMIPFSSISSVRAATSLRSPLMTNQISVVTYNITNTGNFASDYVALCFAIPPQQNGAPIRSLVGFERVHLIPGQSVLVSFPVTSQSVRLVDHDGLWAGRVGVWRFVVDGVVAALHVK